MIEPEKYSWEEQVAIFSNAKAVVGEHGSALKGLLFSPRVTRSVAFNFRNKTQAVIAALKGQQYVALKNSVFDDRRWRKKPYSVDLEKVEQCLKWALG